MDRDGLQVEIPCVRSPQGHLGDSPSHVDKQVTYRQGTGQVAARRPHPPHPGAGRIHPGNRYAPDLGPALLPSVGLSDLVAASRARNEPGDVGRRWVARRNPQVEPPLVGTHLGHQSLCERQGVVIDGKVTDHDRAAITKQQATQRRIAHDQHGARALSTNHQVGGTPYIQDCQRVAGLFGAGPEVVPTRSTKQDLAGHARSHGDGQGTREGGSAIGHTIRPGAEVIHANGAAPNSRKRNVIPVLAGAGSLTEGDLTTGRGGGMAGRIQVRRICRCAGRRGLPAGHGVHECRCKHERNPGCVKVTYSLHCFLPGSDDADGSQLSRDRRDHCTATLRCRPATWQPASADTRRCCFPPCRAPRSPGPMPGSFGPVRRPA